MCSVHLYLVYDACILAKVVCRTENRSCFFFFLASRSRLYMCIMRVFGGRILNLSGRPWQHWCWWRWQTHQWRMAYDHAMWLTGHTTITTTTIIIYSNNNEQTLSERIVEPHRPAIKHKNIIRICQYCFFVFCVCVVCGDNKEIRSLYAKMAWKNWFLFVLFGHFRVFRVLCVAIKFIYLWQMFCLGYFSKWVSTGRLVVT